MTIKSLIKHADGRFEVTTVENKEVITISLNSLGDVMSNIENPIGINHIQNNVMEFFGKSDLKELIKEDSYYIVTKFGDKIEISEEEFNRLRPTVMKLR